MVDWYAENRYNKWENNRFSIKKNRFLWDDNNSPPERLKEIQFSENELSEKTSQINLLKILSTAQTTLFFIKLNYLLKKINISPSYFIPNIFIKFHNKLLCKIQ